MKSVKKSICVILSMCLLLGTLTVSAETVSPDYLYSSAGTAGMWNYESTSSVQSNLLSSLYGGDVGVYFYIPSVGLQGSYIRDLSRKAMLFYYEDDGNNSQKYIGKKEATFAVYNNLYIPYYWTHIESTSDLIESDNTAEMHIVWAITKNLGDTSSAVPAGLLKYKFWVY